MALPHGHYVQLADPLFERHGLGTRYAQVQTAEVGNRVLAYAFLDLVDTTYDLTTSHDNPCDLGAFDDLARAGGDELYDALDTAFKKDSLAKRFATRQQMALALIPRSSLRHSPCGPDRGRTMGEALRAPCLVDLQALGRGLRNRYNQLGRLEDVT